MIRTISSYLGIPPSRLEGLGVFDASIDIDAKFFLDPHLLRRTKIPEFSKSRKKMIAYYRAIICLIANHKTSHDRAWNEALKRLTFKETKEVSIGYGAGTNIGRAIGPELASRLLNSAIEIVNMGIKDPQIFELIGLFEDGFGADRISDMTVAIIHEDILRYSQRITKRLKTNKVIAHYHAGKAYTLIKHPDKNTPLILLPKALLRDLPVALSRDGIDYVVRVNQSLRDEINKLVGLSWKNISKRKLRQYILKNKKYVKDLLAAYTTAKSASYDFEKDPLGEMAWRDNASEFSSKYPIRLSLSSSPTLSDVKAVVKQIVDQFRQNIEVNGLNLHLYVGKKPRHERYSQRLFYAIALSYCEANNLDLSAEPNAGSGPVDFKISSGFNGKVLVEIKLSSNQLVKGFDKQLALYQKSERTNEAFYIVIKVNKSSKSIDKLLRHKNGISAKATDMPEVVIIDGTIKPSASKR